MPLRNRVDPFGQIHAVAERGTLMGNRGGCLHDDQRKLSGRRWASRRWIACVTEFKGRRRVVMTPRRYTELFFLDEATALAAGHRPCFECRRADAVAFAEAWRYAAEGLQPPSADEMDLVLHRQRVVSGQGPRAIDAVEASALPDGCLVATEDGAAWLKARDRWRRWSFEGYGPPSTPRFLGERALRVITPPAMIAALCAGFRPRIHPSADLA